MTAEPARSASSIHPIRRHVGLDILRLAAVLLVLGRHTVGSPNAEPWRTTIEIWRQGGWVGVDLFFVLSGFLVSGLLFSDYQQHRRISLRRFFIRRGWKIYPPFFVFIAFTIVNTAFLSGDGYGRRHLASEILFLQSYLAGIWPHTWSLAVEEHFYVLLPVGLYFLLRARRTTSDPFRPLVAILTLIAIAALLLRVWNAGRHPYAHLTHLYPTHLRIDSLAYGVLLSYWYHFHNMRFVETVSRWRLLLLIGGGVMLVPAFLAPVESTPFIYTAGLSVFAIGSTMILASVIISPLPRNMLLTGLAKLGAYSYSIYLWHMVIVAVGLPFLNRQLDSALGFSAWFALYVVGSLATGTLMARAVEVPSLRLRDKLFPGASSGLA